MGWGLFVLFAGYVRPGGTWIPVVAASVGKMKTAGRGLALPAEYRLNQQVVAQTGWRRGVAMG